MMTGRKVWKLTWAEFPALLLDQMLQFRRAVTRMLRPIWNDLLLACLAPDIRTTFHGTMQVPRLIDHLLVKVTRSAAPVRHP